MSDDATFEYGKNMEQAGPQARAVSASLGLQTGDMTVLSNNTTSNSDTSRARLAAAGLIEQDASGRQRVTAAGTAALNLASAANRLDTAKDGVNPAVDESARSKIQKETGNFNQKAAAFDAARRRGR